MTAPENNVRRATVHSSYLWTMYNEQSKNVVDVSKEDSNICDGLLQATSPRFHTITQRSKTISPKHVPTKEAKTTSLPEIHFVSSETAKCRKPWTPSTTPNEDSQIPMIESTSRSSRVALLAKNGNPICQARVWILAMGALVLILVAISISVALGLTFGRTASITTTSITTISTETTTPPATAWIPINYNTSCLTTCINVSTVTPSTLIASWTFEKNTDDVSGNGRHGQIVNGAAFTNGYVGQAIVLRNGSAQRVNASYISLVSQSFTIEAWIYLYTLSVTSYFGIVGECEVYQRDKCLHYVVYQNKLRMGFYSDDLEGRTDLSPSRWYHAAFVYDYPYNVKSIYLNGLIDAISTSGSSASIGPYLGASGNFLIGTAEISPPSYWDGLLDEVRITNRVKSSCEILNDASLVAHFPFDGNLSDVGPNSMTATINGQGNNGLSWVSGLVNQSLNFNSFIAYFQSCGFYALGQNQPYSIAMWINPSFQSGTLFHLSSAATGSGTWCLPMIGFSSAGSIVGQTRTGSATVSIIGPIPPINTWTHLVQTYSPTNGLRLYINGGLYGTAAATTLNVSSLVMCVLLGSSGLGRNCQTGSISMGPYSGRIDELYVYNRELNNTEVCPLAHP